MNNKALDSSETLVQQAFGTSAAGSGLRRFAKVPLVLFLIAFVFWNPATLPGPQQVVVRLLGSVFAGLISAFFVGTMHLQATVRKIQIAAVGGFAAFCLVFLLWK